MLTKEQENKITKMKFMMISLLSKEIIDPQVNFSTDMILDKVAMRVKGFIYGEEGQEIVIKYPSNWIQALKDKIFPKFLLKRFPVKYIIHTITPRTIYPKFRVSMPDEFHTFNLTEKIED